ncbi:MAG: lysylphosphatidylglycerol synthase transmembrane domain-containing protein [Pseudobdellovibrio sp.]
MNSHLIKNLIRPLTAIIFLFILIKKGPFQLDQIKFILTQGKILLAGAALIFLQFCITAYRWKKLVELKTQISFSVAFQLTLIGQFFSFFIPGGVGGDIVKALELSKSKTVSRGEALSTVIADRLLGLYSMVFFSLLFLLIDYSQDPKSSILKYVVFSGLLFSAMTVGLQYGQLVFKYISNFFNSKENRIVITLQKTITSFDLTFASFRKKQLLFSVILLSLVLQVISIYFMSLIVESLGVAIPSYLIFFSLCCFGFLASAVPITPAGIGVGQAAFYFLFAQFSDDLGKAAVTAISALQLFQFFYALIGGVLFSAKPFLKSKIKA